MLTAGRVLLPGGGSAAVGSSGGRRLHSCCSNSSKILGGSPSCGAPRSLVSTAAFKQRRPADNAPNRGGGAPPRQPGGPGGGGYPSVLPPLDPRDAGGAPPRTQQPPQQLPPNGGGSQYRPAGGAPGPRTPMPPPLPPQPQQFGAAPAAAPGAPPPPPQQQPPPPQQQQQQQQSGYIQQQPPQQQPQQQPGFINPNQSGWGNAPPQQQQQQPGFIKQAPQQQQAFDPEKGGYLTDAGNFMGQGGGYMSQNSGNNAGTAGWQGGYVNTQPQRRQNPNYNGDRWNSGGRNNNTFSGFTDDWSDPNMTTNFLLSQLSSLTNGGEVALDDWATVDDEDDYEDTSPKFVNGKRVLLNRDIADKGTKTVRVQSAEKEDLGVMTLEAAMEQARDLARAMTEQSQVAATAQLATRRPEDMPMPGAVRKSIKARVDVVLINDAADPPVVRLVDFSKYKYDLEKTAKAKQKASKGPEIKEVKLRPVTEKADYETKVRSAQKFLSKGAKVKLTMTFSGREMRFKDQGKEMMLKLIEELADVSKLDAPLALRPSNFSVTLSPLK